MSFSNYEQKVILDGYTLSGVQNVTASYGISEKPIRAAGVGFIDAMIDAPLQGNLSITRTMVGSDPFIEIDSMGSYTYDEKEIEGAVVSTNNDQGFGFDKTRLVRYSVSCNIGEIPEIQTDFTIFGNLGRDVLAVDEINKNENHEYSQFEGDQVFFHMNDYSVSHGFDLSPEEINDDSIALNKNKSEWNDGTISISAENYHSLNDISKVGQNISLGGVYLALGKDAFKKELDFTSIQTKESPPIKYPDQSSMSLYVSDFYIDAITSFSYSRQIVLEPVYVIPRGNSLEWSENFPPSKPNLEPVQVDTQYPIETDVEVTIIAEEYEIRQIKDRLTSAQKVGDLRIEIKDSLDGTIINKFIGKSVRLISESMSLTIEGEMSLTMAYKGYETYHNQIV